MTLTLDLDAILADLGPRCADAAARHDADDSFVAEAYAALREALVPTEFGGGGCSHAEMCSFLRRLAQHCPSTALALSMHQHLVAAAVANYRAGRPGQALLEKVGAGEVVLVSTGANDWLDSNGRAEPVDAGFRVTAAKPFASGSPAGDVLVTSAAIAGGGEVLHFPVPLGADGVSGLGDRAALGMRGTGSQTLKLDEVFVPEEAVVLRRPQGAFHPAFAVILTVAMPIIQSAYLGVADEAASIAIAYARQTPHDPASQTLAGELENRLVAARLATEDMVRMAGNYDFTPSAELARDVLVRKTLAANAVIAVGEKAMELAGGRAYLRKTGVERLLRDLHGAQFHPLPEKRQLLFAGRLALGLDPVAGDGGDSTKVAAWCSFFPNGRRAFAPIIRHERAQCPGSIPSRCTPEPSGPGSPWRAPGIEWLPDHGARPSQGVGRGHRSADRSRGPPGFAPKLIPAERQVDDPLPRHRAREIRIRRRCSRSS